MSLFITFQHIVPQHLLSRSVGTLAASENTFVKNTFIKNFAAKYQVNMAEALEENPLAYKSFNDFFTRALKPNVRPISADSKAIISPADGAISQIGHISADKIFQAKGHSYSTTALVGGDDALAAKFHNSSFATIYLSPKDYHRIHMPCDGTLKRMIYVPGDLFSVNPTTARGVPGLFARNERVVCVFETDREKGKGLFVLVLVGATIVGSMATVWHGQINPPRSADTREWRYDDEPISLKQGDEMGRFMLGSTVVMLFPENQSKKLAFNSTWEAGGAVQLGQVMC
jgi:phosphatidylserine decarboxylase